MTSNKPLQSDARKRRAPVSSNVRCHRCLFSIREELNIKYFIIIVLFLLPTQLLADSKNYYLTGNVSVKWLNEPKDKYRNMELISDVIFVHDEKQWKARSGEIINGASIPPFLWSSGMSPYIGNYRRSTIIHDVYCSDEERRKKHSWQDVHKMMYHAMIADSTSQKEAKLIYAAVYIGGPRWNENGDRSEAHEHAAKKLLSIYEKLEDKIGKGMRIEDLDKELEKMSTKEYLKKYFRRHIPKS